MAQCVQGALGDAKPIGEVGRFVAGPIAVTRKDSKEQQELLKYPMVLLLPEHPRSFAWKFSGTN